jgi:chromosomal replication initiation ATPase DnaA
VNPAESIRHSLGEIRRHCGNVERQLALIEHSSEFLKLIDRAPRVGVGLGEISMAVMEAYGIAPEDFFGRPRPDHVCDARKAYCLLARELTRFSLREIGNHLGGRDHGTVFNAVIQGKNKAEQDAQFLLRLNVARRSLLQITEERAA